MHRGTVMVRAWGLTRTRTTTATPIASSGPATATSPRRRPGLGIAADGSQVRRRRRAALIPAGRRCLLLENQAGVTAARVVRQATASGTRRATESGRTPRRVRRGPAAGSGSRSGGGCSGFHRVSVEIMWLMIERRCASRCSFGGSAVERPPIVERRSRPPGPRSGTSSSSSPWRERAAHMTEPVVRRVERPARGSRAATDWSRARSRSSRYRPPCRRAPSSTSSCSADRGDPDTPRPDGTATPCPDGGFHIALSCASPPGSPASLEANSPTWL